MTTSWKLISERNLDFRERETKNETVSQNLQCIRSRTTSKFRSSSPKPLNRPWACLRPSIFPDSIYHIEQKCPKRPGYWLSWRTRIIKIFGMIFFGLVQAQTDHNGLPT